MAELRNLLSTGQFQKLNTYLQDCEDELTADFRKEYKLLDAYDALAVTDASYEAMLGRWIGATPKSYQPYLARAAYYYNMGWESRGYAWARETSEEQFRRMEDFFDKALDTEARYQGGIQAVTSGRNQ